MYYKYTKLPPNHKITYVSVEMILKYILVNFRVRVRVRVRLRLGLGFTIKWYIRHTLQYLFYYYEIT